MLHTTQHHGREILYCQPTQPNQKPPLLFVHGAFAGAWMWERILPTFAKAGYVAAAVSLRGHGQSDGREQLDWLSIADYVEDLEIAASWLGAPPVLIGHSMGGYVAQKFLESHPALGLALLCSVPPQGLLASQFHLLFSSPSLLIELNRVLDGKVPDSDVVRKGLFAGEISDEIVAEFLMNTQKESQRALWDMSLVNPLGSRFETDLPILVVGAEEDALIPPFLVRSTARTFGVSAHLYAGMGHAITHEKAWPDVSDKILDWLSTVDI